LKVSVPNEARSGPRPRLAKHYTFRYNVEIAKERIMKFILISRHTGGREVPENEIDQNLKDLTEWVGLIKAEVALPTRDGKSVTSKKVEEYRGEVGGVIIFEAESVDRAIALAQKSPGLKYGWTHDIFPEISVSEAARK
jgi:hypothetical protein